MKISDLINLLEKQRQKHGDVEVINDCGQPVSISYFAKCFCNDCLAAKKEAYIIVE